MSTGNMHRQSSRSTYNSDTVDCLVNTSDLALEHDSINQDYEQKRASSDSRRNQTSRRTNGNSIDRSSRHSPPSVTRKRPLSPSSTAVLASRSQHRHYTSQKNPQVSKTPSPPSASASSSRHQRQSRPVTSVKRPHSRSRSPHDRRSSTNRSYPASSKKRTTDNEELTTTSLVKKQTKPARKPEISDLSIVSEDEFIKPPNNQSNFSVINKSSSSPSSTTKLHSTPSVPILQPTSNNSLLEMSHIRQDAELSLFANTALSMMETSSLVTVPTFPPHDFMQVIELMSKYKMMQTIPSNDPQLEACSKEILTLIQKHIQLHKKTLDCRAREIQLHERELTEKEKDFNEKSTRSSSVTSIDKKPVIVSKSTVIEEKSQPEVDITVDQHTKTVLLEEPVQQPVLTTIEGSKVDSVYTHASDKSSTIRKNHGKSRFAPIALSSSVFGLQNNPPVDLYADVDADAESSLSRNATNPLKKPILSPILAPDESTKSILDTDLKITSSNSHRKVEIQSDNVHQSTISKEPPHDLRLTISKSRAKQSNNDDNETIDDQLVTIAEEQTVTMIKPVLFSNNDDKQQSHDYQQQRSVTSKSIEPIIDENMDKRDDRRYQRQHRFNSNRQQQYSADNSSPSTTSSNERSYAHRSTSQQSIKYGSQPRRQDNDDLRSRLFEYKDPKSSRSTHRSNH